MRNLATLAVLGLSALSLAGPIQAEDQTKMNGGAMAADGKPLSGSAGLGYAKTSGNADSSATNFRGELKYHQDRWHHMIGGTAIAASSAASRDEESRTTTEAYWAGIKSQYDITQDWYGFGSVDWYKDRFSAYDNQLYEAAGFGWHVLKGPAHKLDAEIGAGLKQAELKSGEDQNEGIGLLRGIYTWQISETAAFIQRVAVLYGSDNTYSESNTELKAGIVGNLSMVLGYTLKHNSDVELDTSLLTPRNFEKTDRYSTVSLEYKF
jgi:putative salt-induced outer membrane protein